MKFVAIICSIFVLIGLFLSWQGVRTLQTAKQTNCWVETTGTIARSEIVSQRDNDGDRTYKPEIEYEYKANGMSRKGQTIYIGDGASSSDRSYAQRFVSRYPANCNVSVYYNPSDPDISVLEKGIQKASFIPLVFGVGFTFMGVWAYILFWLFQP